MYEDEIQEGAEVVRPFMVTRGRTRTQHREVPIETMVTATSAGRLRAAELQFESRRIVTQTSEPAAIAEIAARLQLPLRAVQILVSDLIADGCLESSDITEHADTNLLLHIRSAITAL